MLAYMMTDGCQCIEFQGRRTGCEEAWPEAYGAEVA